MNTRPMSTNAVLTEMPTVVPVLADLFAILGAWLHDDLCRFPGDDAFRVQRQECQLGVPIVDREQMLAPGHQREVAGGLSAWIVRTSCTRRYARTSASMA